MRTAIMLTLLTLGVALGVVFGQDAGPADETRTASRAPGVREPVDLDAMWSFHWEGKKNNGEFLELLEPDAGERKGESLVLTHLEIRMRQTMRAAVVEHRKSGNQKNWQKVLRRSELFSIGWLDGTTKYMVSGYSSYIGMRFDPDTRPALEITQGSGEMAVYAEGYWAKK